MAGTKTRRSSRRLRGCPPEEPVEVENNSMDQNVQHEESNESSASDQDLDMTESQPHSDAQSQDMGEKSNPNLAEEGENEDDDAPVIFQCGKCNTIVSDSLAGFEADLKTKTIRLRGAVHIAIGDKLSTSTKGPDIGCTYKVIKCACCGAGLGKVYYSTTPALDDYRATYTFDTRALTSYQLGSVRDMKGNAVPKSDEQPSPVEPTVVGEVSNVNEALETLDKHYASMTEALNNLTALVSQQSSQTESHGRSIDEMQRVMLLWEERFQNISDTLDRVSNLEKNIGDASTLNQRIEAVEQRTFRADLETGTDTGMEAPPRPVNARFRTNSYSTPVRLKVAPTISRPPPSPARTPMRKTTLASPMRVPRNVAPSPARRTPRRIEPPLGTNQVGKVLMPARRILE